MLPPAPADETAPLDPLPALTGLESWPHLRFGFAIEPGAAPGGLQLVVAMFFDVPPPLPPVPAAGAAGSLAPSANPAPQKPDEVASSQEPVATDFERYRAICRQWEAEVEVTLEASFCVGPVPPVGTLPPHVIIRQNALTIRDVLERAGAPESGQSIELTPLVFALPDAGALPERYPVKLLQPLAVVLRFSPGTGDEGPGDAKPAEAATEPVAPVVGGDTPEAVPAKPPTPPPSIVTFIPPQVDAGAASRTQVDFATKFEAAYASLGWRVMAEDPAAGGVTGFFLLRWQMKDGLQFSLSEAATPAMAGFACPLISPVGHTRTDISGSLLPAGFPARFAKAESWSVQDFDLDAELGRFLDEVETFLAPERRGRAALVDPTLVGRCVAAKETLASLLAERVVPLGPIQAGSPEGAAAGWAMREACRDDLRNFHRIGAVAVLHLDLAAAQPLVVRGRFVPDAASPLDVLAGASRLAAAKNVVGFPILADAGERGNDLRLPGAFRCEAIEPVAADGHVGRRLHFVSKGDTTVPAPPLGARLPVRAMPRPPDLLRQAFSTFDGDAIAAAKSWRLECDYGCDALAQDTLRFGVVVAPPAGEVVTRTPTPAPAPAPRPDLLDVLVIFQATLPAIRAALDRGLRPAGGAPTASPDPMVGEAVRAFVMLVEWVAQHFNPPPAESTDAFQGGAEWREVTPPPPDQPIGAGPFDITLRQQARCALQVVRNLTTGLPPAFHYATRVVSAAEVVSAFVDRELELDLATLPPLEYYMPDGPARGSLVDCLTRLLRAVIAAPAPAEEAPPLSVSLRVEFAARLAGSGEDGLEVRLPVAIVPPRQISGARRLLEMRAWARPIADQLEAWLAQDDPRRGGGFEDRGARFVFDLSLNAGGNTPGAGGRPWLHWRGLYFRSDDAR